MLDLHSAFENFAPDCDREPPVDTDFITNFLMPYFRNLPRAELAAKVLEIVAGEQDKKAATASHHRTSAIQAPAL